MPAFQIAGSLNAKSSRTMLGGADVVEHQRAVMQMAPRQGALDALLLLAEPVERGVDLRLADGPEAKFTAQARGRRVH